MSSWSRRTPGILASSKSRRVSTPTSTPPINDGKSLVSSLRHIDGQPLPYALDGLRRLQRDDGMRGNLPRDDLFQRVGDVFGRRRIPRRAIFSVMIEFFDARLDTR